MVPLKVYLGQLYSPIPFEHPWFYGGRGPRGTGLGFWTGSEWPKAPLLKTFGLHGGAKTYGFTFSALRAST